MNYIVVGASAGLGRCLAEKLAQKGHKLLLVASSEADLKAISADLQTRYSTRADYLALRVRCDSASVDLVKSAAAKLGEIHGIFFPMGYLNNNDDGTLPAEDIDRIITSNLSGIMAISAAFLEELLARESGILVFFGSVAAERGRSSNISYAAAKRGLQSFYESIRHRCAFSGVRIHFYQLGYLKTAQTFGKKLPFPAADPARAAEYIVGRMEKKSGMIYFPGFWRYICLAVQLTPWCVFKKLKF